MTTFKKILITTIAAAGLALVAAGCKSVPLDASGKNIGAFNYGEFQGLYNTTSPVVAKATHDAIKQLGLVEVAVTNQKFQNTIVCHDENDLKVEIGVEETNSRQTLLHIRWGTGGDLERSRQLYSLVEDILNGTKSKLLR